MLQILENVSLKRFNTFGVEAQARWYVEISSEEELRELFSDDSWSVIPRLVIGGGSNVLFTKDFYGLVIRMTIKGISHEIHGTDVYVYAGAGEVWNELVQYSVKRGFAGVENLSLIPGSVGASPVQNIGAYGVEVKDVFHSCRAYSIPRREVHTFHREDAGFAYRESVFKRELKGQVIITEVCFKLSTVPSLNISYGAISTELEKRGILKPGIEDISSVVSEIRVKKLPDPSTIGNAGSFFKNPIVSVEKFRQLQSTFPDIVHFCLSNSTVKLAAGWLIEQCGWKGKKIKEAGTWPYQALVIVNFGTATGSEVYDLSEQIIEDVRGRFGLSLEREVNVF